MGMNNILTLATKIKYIQVVPRYTWGIHEPFSRAHPLSKSRWRRFVSQKQSQGQLWFNKHQAILKVHGEWKIHEAPRGSLLTISKLYWSTDRLKSCLNNLNCSRNLESLLESAHESKDCVWPRVDPASNLKVKSKSPHRRQVGLCRRG